jgi:hypothetical protein
VADSDPENKVSDVEVPHHRIILAGYANPCVNLVCERKNGCDQDRSEDYDEGVKPPGRVQDRAQEVFVDLFI